MSSSEVRRFINSLPDKRAALQLLGALDQLIPTNKDTALTAHAGGGQTDALVLRADCAFHDVTTVATAADSVVLPYPKAGDVHFIKNSAAANAMQVFAVTPGTIDSVATGTGVSQLAGDGVLYVCCVDGNYIRLGGVSATEVFTTITATTGNITTVNATDLKAGASGTAGKVTVFPSTATKGKVEITATDNTGDTTTSIVVGAMATTRTITLRDPGAAASLLTTTDATAAAVEATAAELTRAADASARIVASTATTLALTVTQHAERVVLINSSQTTNIYNLPAATGSGAKFTIINNFPQTQGTIVVAANGTDVIKGVAVNIDATGASSSKSFFTSATSDKITFNLTTTGGPVGGDMVEAWDTAANAWTVRVLQVSSGAIATPFSAT